MRSHRPITCDRGSRGNQPGFSLLELLVVLVIIGILAALALPSINGLRRSSGTAAVSRQLLDDTALARRLAMLNRTTVVMVFIPPADLLPEAPFQTRPAQERNIVLRGQQRSYALFSFRQVGDQPGRATPRYLKGWTPLPEGFIIPRWKFETGAGVSITNLLTAEVATQVVQPFLQIRLPVPTVNTVNPAEAMLPYIAFGPEGRLQRLVDNVFVDLSEDEVIPVARGSVLLSRLANGNYEWVAPDTIERPAGNSTNTYNMVVIDAMTGRSRVMRPDIQ